MATLRIYEVPGSPGDPNAVVSFDDWVEYPITIMDPFPPSHEERPVWFFEEHLKFPFTQQVRAGEAAASITIYGDELFKQVFAASEAYHHIEAIVDNPALRNARIKISLNRLRVAGSPASGMHHILLHFFAQNQGRIEPVHFNATYRVHEGESAGIQGYPIFVELGVGQEGLNVKCRMINVGNDQDEAFLHFLESNTFKARLQLISTAQHVITPFSEMALGPAKTIAACHRNVLVEDFELGLDFSLIPPRGRLADGSYLAVRIPESFRGVWDWNEWVYLSARGQVVKSDDLQVLIPYNSLVFGIR